MQVGGLNGTEGRTLNDNFGITRSAEDEAGCFEVEIIARYDGSTMRHEHYRAPVALKPFNLGVKPEDIPVEFMCHALDTWRRRRSP